MLLRRAAAPAVALALALVAAPGEGASVRVVKRGTAGARHVFWIEPDHAMGPSRTPAGLFVGALPPTLAAGDRYDVIDQAGWVGRVVIDSVELVPLGCPGAHYAKGRARFEQPPARAPQNPAVAVGPLSAAPLKARVLLEGEAGKDLPERGLDVMDRQLVDLDGDGKADLVRQYAPCGAVGGRPDGYCFATWGRRGGRWVVVEEAKIPNCY